MTIDRAITILTHPQFPGPLYTDEEYAKAKKLGIEALKRIQRARDQHLMASPMPLPGETTD